MKQKQWSYPSYAKVIDTEGKTRLTVLTQFYQIGIYVAVYHSTSSIPEQLSMKPQHMKKFMGQFNTNNLTEQCKDWTVEFGSDVVVTEENGLYKQLS